MFHSKQSSYQHLQMPENKILQYMKKNMNIKKCNNSEKTLLPEVENNVKFTLHMEYLVLL